MLLLKRRRGRRKGEGGGEKRRREEEKAEKWGKDRLETGKPRGNRKEQYSTFPQIHVQLSGYIIFSHGRIWRLFFAFKTTESLHISSGCQTNLYYYVIGAAHIRLEWSNWYTLYSASLIKAQFNLSIHHDIRPLQYREKQSWMLPAKRTVAAAGEFINSTSQFGEWAIVRHDDEFVKCNQSTFGMQCWQCTFYFHLMPIYIKQVFPLNLDDCGKLKQTIQFPWKCVVSDVKG